MKKKPAAKPDDQLVFIRSAIGRLSRNEAQRELLIDDWFAAMTRKLDEVRLTLACMVDWASKMTTGLATVEHFVTPEPPIDLKKLHFDSSSHDCGRAADELLGNTEPSTYLEMLTCANDALKKQAKDGLAAARR